MVSTNRQIEEQFIQQGLYLRGWSTRTVRTYRQGLATLKDVPLTKMGLQSWVVGLKQRGLSAGGVNMYARTVNSFLSWLHEEGELPERLRVKLLPNSPTPIDLLSGADIRRLLTFKPQGLNQTRAWTLIVTLIDTGLRIDEALGLERKNMNLEALTLRVLGKGHKERLVPISIELRKHLFKFTSKTSTHFIFGTSNGGRLVYRNAFRDVVALCKGIGIAAACNPHAFRHYFAVGYVRNGGDIYRLSRILGHSSITTTSIYLRSMGVEHLREGHERFSPLMLR